MINQWEPIPHETPIDPSLLIDKSIRTRSQLNEAQAENIRKAVVKYLAAKPSRKTAPFTYDWMLSVHKLMFGDVLITAGQQSGSTRTIGVPCQLITPELGELALRIGAWNDSWPRLHQAVDIHYNAVRIHPFDDGNGRWSRLLANIWLKRHGERIIEWPEPEMGNNSSPIRQEYIKCLKLADSSNDLTALIELHSRFWQPRL